MQQITILGHIGQDAILRNVDDQNNVLSFSVAVSENFTNRKGERISKTAWYEVAVWNKAKLAEYLKKGQRVLIQGTPRFEAYLPKAGGEPIAKISIVADRLEFAGSTVKKEEAEKTQSTPAQMPNMYQKEESPF